MASTDRKLTDKQILDNKTNSVMQTVAKRAAYYRANVNRFVEDYLQINYLKLFQKIILHAMFTHNSMVFVMGFKTKGRKQSKEYSSADPTGSGSEAACKNTE